MKVMTIVGTRPEIIRLYRVIAVLDRLTDHTGVTTLELVEVVTLILRNFPTLNGLYQVEASAKQRSING